MALPPGFNVPKNTHKSMTTFEVRWVSQGPEVNVDGGWYPAIYHPHYVALVSQDLYSTAYTLPRAEGKVGDFNGAFDKTAFLPAQADWGGERADRPDILFELHKLPGTHEPSNPDMLHVHAYGAVRIVIDAISNNPLRDFEILPLTISTEVEGWLLEAWFREDPALKIQDVIQRMPYGYADAVYDGTVITNRFARRRSLFRLAGRCLSWVKSSRNSKPDEALIQEHAEKTNPADPNSTRHLTDLNAEEKKEVNALTYASGKYLKKGNNRTLHGDRRQKRNDEVTKTLAARDARLGGNSPQPGPALAQTLTAQLLPYTGLQYAPTYPAANGPNVAPPHVPAAPQQQPAPRQVPAAPQQQPAPRRVPAAPQSQPAPPFVPAPIVPQLARAHVPATPRPQPARPYFPVAPASQYPSPILPQTAQTHLPARTRRSYSPVLNIPQAGPPKTPRQRKRGHSDSGGEEDQGQTHPAKRPRQNNDGRQAQVGRGNPAPPVFGTRIKPLTVGKSPTQNSHKRTHSDSSDEDSQSSPRPSKRPRRSAEESEDEEFSDGGLGSLAGVSDGEAEPPVPTATPILANRGLNLNQQPQAPNLMNPQQLQNRPQTVNPMQLHHQLPLILVLHPEHRQQIWIPGRGQGGRR